MYRPVKIEAFDLQSMGARLVVYGDINDDKMPYFNPSIAWFNGKIKIAIRKCNFTTIRHGNWKFLDGNIYSKTDVLYGDLDKDTLEVSNLQTLKLKNAPIETRIAGLEDVRLFARGNRMYAIGFEVDRITPVYYKRSGMAFYEIRDGELIHLESLEKPDIDLVEKNWQPTDVETEEFDYTYSPTQIYDVYDLIGEPYKGDIHGGTQLLLQDDGSYLSLVHEKKQDPRYGRVYDKYVYHTFLARHSQQGFITHLTPPFTFGTHENIEFASGMVEYNGDLIISLGIRDAKFGIARIKKDKLVGLLEPWSA